MSADEGSPETRKCYVTRQTLLWTFDGDLDFVQEIVTLFVTRWPVLMAEIGAAFAAGDEALVRDTAHTLTGSIGYFEESSVHAAARRIERIPPGGLWLVPALHAELQNQLEDLTRHLRKEFLLES